MRNSLLIILLLEVVLCFQAKAQTSSLTVTTSVSKELEKQFEHKGRIFLFINNSREPRLNTWPNKSNWIFATNIENWDSKESFTFDNSVKLTKSLDVSLDKLPNGKYRIQV